MQAARFRRVDVLRRNRDVTAGYGLGDGADVVVATVRVRATEATIAPLISGSHAADPEASAQPLQDSIAQVRHYYPTATLRNVHAVYLVKRGQLQGGRAATLRYEDLLGGQRRKIDLDIYVFCCVDARTVYEYRIRHAADNDVNSAVVPFMQALAWSAEPSSSIDADAAR